MNETRQERLDALNQFATRPEAENAPLPAVMASALPQVFGAQPVAVYRDERAVLQKLKGLAAAAGDDWYYRFPVKNRKTGRTDYIEGPSIKLANDLARLYGNCEVDCRAQDMGNVILFHARFLDLETGYSLTRPFQQRKSAAKIGGSDDERREDIAFQIGASKAIRNVTVNALQTYADFAFEEAKAALVDKIGKELPRYRKTTIERVSAHVDITRVEAIIGRKADDWLAPDVAKVIAMMKSVQDGMATLAETFPPLGGDEPDMTRQTVTKLDTVGETETTKLADLAEDAEVEVEDPDRSEMIAKVLQLATDKSITPEERVEALTSVEDGWVDHLGDPDIVANIFKVAKRIASGELAADAGRKYLLALAGGPQ